MHIDYGDLKLAPSLTESCVKPSHFDKMKVGLAVRLLNHDTAAALRYCVERNVYSTKKPLRQHGFAKQCIHGLN
jgi:hypothetical protein